MKDETDIVADFQLFIDIKPTVYNERTIYITTEILPVFLRKSSWVGSRLPRSALVQYSSYKGLLFYVYAMKLKQKLDQHSFSLGNFREEIRKLYNEVYEELSETLRKYSKETLSGTKAKEQRRWEAYINEELLKLPKAQ